MNESCKIVVAVDASPDSRHAARWAVLEARRRQLPLVLVHVVPHLLREEHGRMAEDQMTDVDRVLREARQEAAHAPAVETEFLVLEPLGPEVAPVIVESAGAGDTLVLGARGHGRVAGLLLGSVSQHVVRRGRGTVVVVRHRHDQMATRTVVGFDSSPDGQRALDWALSRADDQGGEVVALRARHGMALQGAANVLPVPTDAVWQQETEDALLEAELAPWREKHPRLRLRGEAVPGHPGRLLSTASRHAGLVVVGSRRRGTLAETLLGSVAQHVLRHARSPVAVVP